MAQRERTWASIVFGTICFFVLSATNLWSFDHQGESLGKAKMRRQAENLNTSAYISGFCHRFEAEPAQAFLIESDPQSMQVVQTYKVIYTTSTPTTSSDLYIVNENGTGNKPLANSPYDEVFYLADSTSQRVVYSRNENGTFRYYSIRSDGYGQVLLDQDNFVYYEESEKIFLDETSGRVVLQLKNNCEDLYSCLPNGSDWKILSEHPDRDFFRCSTPNRFLFVRFPLGPSQFDLFSVTHRGVDLRPLANQPTVDEDLIWWSDKWKPVIRADWPTTNQFLF